MNESEPIDLSKLQNLTFRPNWVEDLQKAEAASGEVVWAKGKDSWRTEDYADRGANRDGRRSFGGGGGGGDRRGPRPERKDGPPRPAGPTGDNRGPRPERRDFSVGARNDHGTRPAPGPRGPTGPRPPGPAGQGLNRGGERREFRGPPQGDRRNFRGGDQRDFRPEPPPGLLGWIANLLPDPRSVEAIARQIKASGRAFGVFDVGRLFTESRDRYRVHFLRRPSGPPPPQHKKGEPNTQESPQPPPPAHARREEGPMEIFRCETDGSLWVTRESAVRHLLQSDILEIYYRKETITLDPPKGNFTSIAVCGFSGALLGPPNHHDFQRNIMRIHREQFSNLALDRYKARIRIEKDPEMIQKWQDSVTTAVQWVPITDDIPQPEPAPAPEMPSETVESADPTEDQPAPTPTSAAQTTSSTVSSVALKSHAEMGAHFMANHAAAAITAVREATVPANIPDKLLAQPLLNMLRNESERQQRFPMQLVQILCRELEGRGLRFFKRDHKNTYVSRTRPHFIPDDLVLSNRIRSIIEMVRANPAITYTRLVTTLAPHIDLTPPPVSIVAAEAPKPEAPVAEKTETTITTEPIVEAMPPVEEQSGDPAPPVVAAPSDDSGTPTAEAPASPYLSPEEIAILQDLRWLVQEGFVTEFQNGELFVLGRLPVPPQPKKVREPRPPRDPRPPRTEPTAGTDPTGSSLDAKVETAVGTETGSVESVSTQTAIIEDFAPSAEAIPTEEASETAVIVNEEIPSPALAAAAEPDAAPEI